MDLTRLRERFEIATANFGRSCWGLKSNEMSFQAWFAASVIQEFGIERVHREVHLPKGGLNALTVEHEFTKELRSGNELKPDLCVTRMPGVDTRHAATREADNIGEILRQLAIISEFKVTGSTKDSTSPKAIEGDLKKLAVFAEAVEAACSQKGVEFLPCYLVILDNNERSGNGGKFTTDYMRARFEAVKQLWPAAVTFPSVLVTRSVSDCVQTDVYHDWELEKTL